MSLYFKSTNLQTDKAAITLLSLHHLCHHCHCPHQQQYSIEGKKILIY